MGEEDFEEMKMVRVLVIDFDNSIRTSKSGQRFIAGPEDVLLYPDVEEKLWDYRNEGCFILGISNQGGVAFGYKTAEDVEEEFVATYELFTKNPFHCVKACYAMENGTVAPYKYRSLSRKPGYGMLATLEFDLDERGLIPDWNNSLYVGEREEDRKCAENAGIAFEYANEFFGRVIKPEEYVMPVWANDPDPFQV